MKVIGILSSVFMLLLAAVAAGAMAAWLLGGDFAGLVGAIIVAGAACVALPLYLDHRLTRASQKTESDARSMRFQVIALVNTAVLVALIGGFPRSSRRALESQGAWFVRGQPDVLRTLATVARHIPRSDEPVVPGQTPSAAVAASGPAPRNSAEPLPLVSASVAPTSLPAAATPSERVFQEQSSRVVVIETRVPLRSGDPVAVLYAQLGVQTLDQLGSGCIVDPTGLVLTAAHVLDGAQSVRIRTQRGQSFDEVTRVAHDRAHDLALLQVQATEALPTVTLLGQGETVAVGSPAIAIGSPMGLEYTVTEGIIGGRRTMHGTDFLQTQAPLAPGSSGGPLFDQQGRVIGIDAASKYPGLNLAIATRHVHELLGQRREPKPYQRYVPGARVTEVRLDGAQASSSELVELSEFLKLLAAGAEGCVKAPAPDAQMKVEFPPPGDLREGIQNLLSEPTVSGTLPSTQADCMERNLSLFGRILQLYLAHAHAEALSDSTGVELEIVISGLQNEQGRPDPKRSLRITIALLAGAAPAP